jgi:hypothetical protein
VIQNAFRLVRKPAPTIPDKGWLEAAQSVGQQFRSLCPTTDLGRPDLQGKRRHVASVGGPHGEEQVEEVEVEDLEPSRDRQRDGGPARHLRFGLGLLVDDLIEH